MRLGSSAIESGLQEVNQERTAMTLEHPTPIHPQDFAVYDQAKMGKSTLFQSERLLVGLNAFEPGQEHKLHAHAGLDKVYHVLAGSGLFLLEGREVPMRAGDLLIAPAEVPHGIRNTGGVRLLVLAILAPSP
jgi:mannose-6-phosphate isomerase-like protein (cupin superfamily)